MTRPDYVRRLIAEELGQPEAGLPESLPIREAVSDSYALVELVIRLQEETGRHVSGEDMQGVLTVGDLVEIFADDRRKDLTGANQ